MLAARLYRGDPQGMRDRLRLALATARGKAVQETAALIEAGGYARLLAFLDAWARPVLPVRAADLKEIGASEGPALGKLLRTVEDAWIGSGFSLDRDALLERAAAELAKDTLGRVADLFDARADRLDHRLADLRLAMRLAHVLDGAAHHFRFLAVARVPVAAGNERPAVKFLHRCSPFLFE